MTFARLGKICRYALFMMSVAGCVGCGGGGQSSGGSSAPPPAPGFTLVLTPASITLSPGQTQTVSVAVDAENGFSSSVTVKAADPSGGVTIAPASLSLNPGTPGTMTLAAAGDATLGAQNVTISGSSGTLSGQATLPLKVAMAPVPDPYQYVGGALVHGFFDESRQLLFATNPYLNEVDVFSGKDDSLKNRIPVPQPWGIDQMADGKTLVVGTQAQDIVTINEDTFAVTLHPHAASETSLSLFFPGVLAMANGKVLVFGVQQGISSGGTSPIFEWDSEADTWTQLAPPAAFPVGWDPTCAARSKDHRWAVFAADQFYRYDSTTNNLTSAPLSNVNPPDDTYGVRGCALNADGSKLAVVSANEASFFDASLSLLGTASIPDAFQAVRTAVQFSPDGQALYLQYDMPLEIEKVDPNTHQSLGYYSGDVMSTANYDQNDEGLLAIDAAGHAYVGIDDGLRMVDLTRNPIPNTNHTSNGFHTPPCSPLLATLPLNTAQTISANVQYSLKEQIYIGGQYAPWSFSGGLTQLQVPASATPGPADIECIEPQTGDSEVMIAGVSFGTDPIALNSNLLPTQGNPDLTLYGYGFFTGNELGWQTDPPYTGSVLLGGLPALNPTVLGGVNDPTTLGGLTFQAPSGTPGESADVSVTSSIGQGSLHGAATYYTAPRLVSNPGVLGLVYDSHRNVVYALKSNEIDVLDATSLQWQPPIPFPTSLAADGDHVGMALSPDGSELVVVGSSVINRSVALGSTIFVLDPDGTSSPKVITYTGTASLTGSVAITAADDAILAGNNRMLVLNHSDDSLTPIGTFLNSPQIVKASADGSHVYGVDVDVTSGNVFSVDPNGFAVNTESFAFMFWSDLAVSPDGSQWAAIDVDNVNMATGVALGFFDPELRTLNANVYPMLASPDTAGLMGTVYSPGGKVLVAPERDALEVWDAATGTLRARIMSSVPLQNPAVGQAWTPIPELATDAAGQTIYAITTSGVLVFSLPSPLDQFPAHAWPHLPAHSPAPGVYGSLSARMAIRHAKTQAHSTKGRDHLW